MKRAGISLALVVMLLLGAAAPVQAQAEETGLAAEAESFYRSVLAAKDRETLQTYLDCFSDQRRVELRAELPATLRQGLDTVLQQMKLPSITPVEENTLSKLANGITDTPVTLAVKAHLRNCRPVLIALSSNDALGANAKNLGHLLNTKNVYFVPMGQDAPDIKTKSLIADFSIVPDAVKLALNGKQAEPVFKNL